MWAKAFFVGYIMCIDMANSSIEKKVFGHNNEIHSSSIVMNCSGLYKVLLFLLFLLLFLVFPFILLHLLWTSYRSAPSRMTRPTSCALKLLCTIPMSRRDIECYQPGNFTFMISFQKVNQINMSTWYVPLPRCELRIPGVSESNRCHIGRQGCRERTTLGRQYFSRQLCNLACRYLIGWWALFLGWKVYTKQH